MCLWFGFSDRLKDYPQYCQHLASISHFIQFPHHLQEVSVLLGSLWFLKSFEQLAVFSWEDGLGCLPFSHFISWMCSFLCFTRLVDVGVGNLFLYTCLGCSQLPA